MEFITLRTCQDLDSINDNSDNIYNMANDIDCTQYTNYTPAYNFDGIFEGNNFKVFGLNLTGDVVGMFASTSVNATVKDLYITNSIFNGNTVGALAGLIQGFFVNISCYGNQISGKDGVGGLGGKATAGNLDLSQCKSYLNTITLNQSGSKSIGGLIGYSKADLSLHHQYIGCSSYSNIITAGTNVSSSDEYGGFVGYLFNAEVESCTSSNNTITGSEDNFSGVGGFAGYFQGNISNSLSTMNTILTNDSSTASGFIGTMVCMTSCTVKNSNSTANYVAGGSFSGGFLGQLFSPGLISNCASVNNLIEGKTSSSSLSLARGGFIGFQLYGLITNCTSVSNEVYSQGNNWKSSMTGGFVGLSSSSFNWCTSINNTVFTEMGDVGGFAGSSSIGNISNSMVLNDDGTNSIVFYTTTGNAGGMVGSSSNLFLNNCLVVASGIKVKSGGKFSGGIIGNRSSTSVSITNSYFVGRTFSQTDNNRGGGYIGGGVSDTTPSYPVNHNYWDSSYLSAKPFVGDSAFGISSSKFKEGKVFPSWNSQIWCFVKGYYPFLNFDGSCKSYIYVPPAPKSPYPDHTTRNALISVFVILIFVIGAIVGIYFYRKKKNDYQAL